MTSLVAVLIEKVSCCRAEKIRPKKKRAEIRILPVREEGQTDSSGAPGCCAFACTRGELLEKKHNPAICKVFSFRNGTKLCLYPPWFSRREYTVKFSLKCARTFSASQMLWTGTSRTIASSNWSCGRHGQIKRSSQQCAFFNTEDSRCRQQPAATASLEPPAQPWSSRARPPWLATAGRHGKVSLQATTGLEQTS